jgi:hypothetical protein
MKGLPLSRSYAPSECENLMATHVESALPIFKPQESFQSTIGPGEHMFFQELKSIAKESSEHAKVGSIPSLSRPRFGGPNGNDVNLDTSASETPSPETQPGHASAGVNLDHVRDEHHRETSETMGMVNDADGPGEGEHQNAPPDHGSERKKGKRSR